MPSIVYGFKQLLDIPTRRAVTIDPRQLQSAIAYSQQQHDQELTTILRLFADETTAIQLKFKGGGIVTENQPMDEFARARKIKGARTEYTAGFPIYTSGQARGINFIARAKMTIQQFNDELDAIYRGDFRWCRNRLLATIFWNTARTVDDPESVDGAVSVSSMANADTVEYATNGSESTATDDHYLAFADPVDDTHNPLPTIRDELLEHEVNGGEVVVFISTSLKLPTPTTGFEALTDFVGWGELAPDPAIVLATPLDRIIRPLNMTLPPGATYLGRAGKCHIVEWPSIPAGYGFALSTDGDRPLKARVDVEVELRGFKPVATRNDFPYFEEQWMRRLGFGGWNRVAMVVFQVGAGSYSIPSAYTGMRWA